MHENLIANWVRGIPWKHFWEPETPRQALIKWGVSLLTLALGICIFLHNLDGLQAYEYALQNPLILEAEKEIVPTMSATGYDIYASYRYGGVEYQHIYYGRYSTDRGDADIIWSPGAPIVIAVDPNHPGVPIKFMFREITVFISVVLASLGFASLLYGAALEFPRFRKWRVARANRPGFFSRPYGKPVNSSEHPDYLKDAAFTWFSVLFTFTMILGFLFPNTFF